MSKRDSVLDLFALGVVSFLFVVGWVAFAFTQPFSTPAQYAVIVVGALAFSISLNRLGRVEPLVGGGSDA